MKRNNSIHIPLSTKEKDILKQRAEDTGLTLTSYCRLLLIKSRPKIVLEE